MVFFLYSMMLFLGILMFYGQAVYKKKRAEWGKFLTLISCFGIIGLAIYLNGFHDKIQEEKIAERERAYGRSQALVLSSYLSTKYFGNGKCLAIYLGYGSEGEIEAMTQVANDLKEGFGGKVKEVKLAPLFKRENNSENTFIESDFGPTAEHYNKVLRENPDYDVVILLSGLSMGIEELFALDFFTLIEDPEKENNFIKDPSKKYPLIGIYNGSFENMEMFLNAKLIGAVCTWKPNQFVEVKDQPAPLNVKEAFDERYLLMTPDNVATLKKQYPELFPQMDKK